MTAESLMRRLAGLTAAYALALHAILAASLMAAAAGAVSPAGICAGSPDGGPAPAVVSHDCAVVCGGCSHAPALPAASRPAPTGAHRHLPRLHSNAYRPVVAIGYNSLGPRAPPRG